MKQNRLFNTPIILALLMLIGLMHITHDLPLSIIIGICLYVPAYLIDQVFNKDGRY